MLAVVVAPPALVSARTTALKALDRDTRVAATAFALADFVIISNWEQRYRAEAATYPEEYAIYQGLREHFQAVQVFHPGPLMLGPTMTILKAR